MKKRILIAVCVLVALALVVFFPIGLRKYDDGGTTEYSTLVFKVVKWNRFIAVYDENGEMSPKRYTSTRVYFLPDNFKSLTELWEEEKPSDLEFY